MHRDFTLSVYKNLLESFLEKDYKITSFEDFLRDNYPRCVILRHDVDDKPGNALVTAELENKLHVRGTYYFRIVRQCNKPHIIKGIAELGHEIGYHYEDFSLAGGDYQLAYEKFLQHLAYFRNFYPVRTICMHGNPLSFLDNKKLWDRFDYRELDIAGEPYFDVDFNKVLYLTDTGRCWNSSKSNYFDKVSSGYHFNISTTQDIISFLQTNELPDQIMITFHPERWNEKLIPWTSEYLGQNFKNLVKAMLRNFIKK